MQFVLIALAGLALRDGTDPNDVNLGNLLLAGAILAMAAKSED